MLGCRGLGAEKPGCSESLDLSGETVELWKVHVLCDTLIYQDVYLLQQHKVTGLYLMQSLFLSPSV